MPSNVVLALDIGSQVASVIPLNGLGLSTIFDIAKQIAELAEKAKADRRTCAVLARKASDLVVHVKTVADVRSDMVSPEMQKNVSDLEQSLVEVQRKLQDVIGITSWRRIFARNHIAGTLEECLTTLDGAWRMFDTDALVLIQQAQIELMERQSYDETHHIFRLIYTSANDSIVEEEIGEVHATRALVKVQKLKPGSDPQDFWKQVEAMKPHRHPNIVQALGYSSKYSKLPFYVLTPVLSKPLAVHMFHSDECECEDMETKYNSLREQIMEVIRYLIFFERGALNKDAWPHQCLLTLEPIIYVLSLQNHNPLLIKTKLQLSSYYLNAFHPSCQQHHTQCG